MCFMQILLSVFNGHRLKQMYSRSLQSTQILVPNTYKFDTWYHFLYQNQTTGNQIVCNRVLYAQENLSAKAENGYYSLMLPIMFQNRKDF